MKNQSDFVWLRQLDQQADKQFIYYEPYPGPEVFKDIPALRARITETNLRDVQKDHIYVTNQAADMAFPFISETINFKNNFAIETRGLWKVSDSSGGGPFISLTFADTRLGRLYYIEGYVYAPSKDKKRDFIRELETILHSFEVNTASASSVGL